MGGKSRGLEEGLAAHRAPWAPGIARLPAPAGLLGGHSRCIAFRRAGANTTAAAAAAAFRPPSPLEPARSLKRRSAGCCASGAVSSLGRRGALEAGRGEHEADLPGRAGRAPGFDGFSGGRGPSSGRSALGSLSVDWIPQASAFSVSGFEALPLRKVKFGPRLGPPETLIPWGFVRQVEW